MTDLTIPLSSGFVTHGTDGKKKMELTLREPTARDFADLGVPYRSISYPDGGTETKPDMGLCMKWLARLSGEGELILGNMSKNDYWACLNAVIAWIGADEDSEATKRPNDFSKKS